MQLTPLNASNWSEDVIKLRPLAQATKARAGQEIKTMDRKYTVKFQITLPLIDTAGIEYSLEDLLKVSVLPALNAEIVPLSFEIKKAKK
jgi:hypothetical protein